MFLMDSMSYTYKRENVSKALVGRTLPGIEIVISFYGPGQAQLFLQREGTDERVNATQISVRDSDNTPLRVADNGYFITWTESYKIYVREALICTISNQKQQSFLFNNKNSGVPDGVKRFSRVCAIEGGQADNDNDDDPTEVNAPATDDARLVK